LLSNGKNLKFINRDKSGDLSSLWNILFMATALMVLIIIPWTLYFYESDDDLTMVNLILIGSSKEY
jgi:hypothetical protein